MPSEKILQTKQAEVAQIAEEMKASLATVLVSTRGLTVEQDTELRNALRKAGVKFAVRKNTLAFKAAQEVGIEGTEEMFKGPTAIATSADSYTDAAKILCEYEAKFDKLEVKGGILDGKVISAAEVKDLSKMPSKEELVARVLGGLNAPISGLVNVLNGNIRGLVVALNAIAEKQSA